MKKNEVILGVDIGSAHLKVYSLTEGEGRVEIFPVGLIVSKLKEKEKSRLKDIIFPLLNSIIAKMMRNYERVYVNFVTSIEAAYPEEEYLSSLMEFAEAHQDVEFYILDDDLLPKSVEDVDKWPYLSSINSLRYLSTKFIENGILIHMNSSSTVFIPVKSGKEIPLELHYSSGIGMWVGALYRHAFNVSSAEVYLFGRKGYISPTAGSITDILFQIKPSKIRRMLEEHHAPLDIDSLHANSLRNLSHLLGILPEREYRNPFHGGFFDKKNQIKIASYHIYGNFLYAIFENVIKILSEVDIDVEKAHFLVSGIGEPILEDALYLFGDKIERMSQKLQRDCSIILEAYGAALSLRHMLEVKDENA